MAKVDTRTLQGRPLDWAVTAIELERHAATGGHVKEWVRAEVAAGTHADPYSSDPLWGAELLEREGIATRRHSSGRWYAMLSTDLGDGQRADWSEWTARGGERVGPGWDQIRKRRQRFDGDSVLEAGLRCYVASVRGEKMEVPEALMQPRETSEESVESPSSPKP